MRPIPLKLRTELSNDPYYLFCCLTGLSKAQTKIDWHHAWQYGKKGQINEKWAIMPISEMDHAYYGDKLSVHNSITTREYVQYLSLKRATNEDLKKYPKKNWQQIKKYLYAKFRNTTKKPIN